VKQYLLGGILGLVIASAAAWLTRDTWWPPIHEPPPVLAPIVHDVVWVEPLAPEPMDAVTEEAPADPPPEPVELKRPQRVRTRAKPAVPLINGAPIIE
jgi:hypothetical protein